MQREEPDGIVISCDFCGQDWDEIQPMIEGHRGSVLCLGCLKLAMDGSVPTEVGFDCALCLQSRDAGRKVWRHAEAQPSDGLNPQAALCFDCVRLAAKGFHKDKDTDFRWEPAKYPVEK